MKPKDKYLKQVKTPAEQSAVMRMVVRAARITAQEESIFAGEKSGPFEYYIPAEMKNRRTRFRIRRRIRRTK